MTRIRSEDRTTASVKYAGWLFSIEYLNKGGNYVIVATHDIELTELLKNTYSNYHFNENIENDLLSFDFKLKKDKSIHTNAIKILEINKFPKEITEEAKNLAKEFDVRVGKKLF